MRAEKPQRQKSPTYSMYQAVWGKCCQCAPMKAGTVHFLLRLLVRVGDSGTTRDEDLTEGNE